MSTKDALASLAERLSPGAVSTHPGELTTHAHDRWALALLREIRGDRVPPPAALVFPKSIDEVARTLAWATETGTAIVPRGGASGLSGGAEAIRGSVMLDLSKMNRVLAVDDVSQTVTAQAGTRGADLEAALTPRGLTIGHYPESFEMSTVGGWIASASAGYASAGYGAIEDLLVGTTVVLGSGETLALKAVPRTAAGPDLRRVFVGSEGALGVITEATLAVARAPRGYLWEAFRPHSFETGAALVREVIQRGFRPLLVRLFDEVDASAVFSAFGHEWGALLVLGFDAGAPGVEAQRLELKQLARDVGTRAAGTELAEHWWSHRLDPLHWYLAVMGEERAMGSGVMADSVEVAGVWRHLPRLYEEVRGALLDHAESVGCRLGHAHPSGAALQFPFLLRAADDSVVEKTYRQAWEAAAMACVTAGGTLSHDQGVGLLKVPFIEAELGRTGVDALRAIKSALDPKGVLNPGKLIPPADTAAAAHAEAHEA